ncbi:cation:proton antiporter [Deinococcus lacus]|uniref:Cation:proton antiporter n=1 Tax=Deinococcus lacus TaxID=392561 RepID=A0ABW1YCW2_9DEIO
MSLLDLSTFIVAVTALSALLNARVLKLPASIGVTVVGLLFSLLLLGLGAAGVPLAHSAVMAVRAIDFDSFVFQGVLSFLLFAGALGLHTGRLWELRTPVITFALVSTLLSTALVGGLTYALLSLFGLSVPLVLCLLFGALISPTDPVAVLGMLRQARVPERIETIVAGESLFNDGVGVVAFTVLAGLAVASGAHGELSVTGVTGFFLQEAVGGLLLGSVLGLLGWWALRSTSDFVTEILLSLLTVMACTALAPHLHVSAPLAAVMAGLLVSLLTDRETAALSSREKFRSFWHLIDELLNIFLFLMLALELLVLDFSAQALLLGVLTIPLVLFSRALSVQLPFALLARAGRFTPFTRRVLVWGACAARSAWPWLLRCRQGRRVTCFWS